MAEKTGPGVEGVSTGELIRQVREGDQQALDRLCRRFLPRLKAWATGRLPPTARALRDTDDLVQETLIRTLARLDAFEDRGDGALEAYMVRGVMNGIRTEVRRHTQRRTDQGLPEDLRSRNPSPLEEALGADVVSRYEAALERLDPGERDAVVLRVELNFDYEQIAQALDKPSKDAARMAVTRALLKLAREMGDGD